MIIIPIATAKNTTVNGIVLDNLENLIGGAELKINCMNRELITDKFGSFKIKNIVSGNCRIYATYKDGVGFKDINITENQTINLKIKLDKTIIQIKRTNFGTPYLIVFAIVFILILLIEHNKKRKQNKKKPKKIKRFQNKKL